MECPQCPQLNSRDKITCAACGFRFTECETAASECVSLEPLSSSLDMPLWECTACLSLNAINMSSCDICQSQAPEWVVDMTHGLELEHRVFSKQTERHIIEMQKQFAMDEKDLVENDEKFECQICFVEIAPGAGIRLRGCLHDVCKQCLTQAVEVEETGRIRCGVCNFEIEDRDIVHVVSPQLWERRLQRVARQAGAKMENVQVCRRPNCAGFAEVIGGKDFTCPVCNGVTCLRCAAFHPEQNCQQYQAFLNRDVDAQRSQEMLETLLRTGEAMRCSGCQMIVQKNGGCDFIRCGNCKMELCWLTKGPRWGPGGPGDTSGGCRCGVNGRKCHPNCQWCHN